LHLEDKSIAEIRQLTGWSVATVKVRAFRADGSCTTDCGAAEEGTTMKLELELLEKLFAAAKAVGHRAGTNAASSPDADSGPLARSASARNRHVAGFIPLFRRAFICAGIVTLLALAWSYHDLTSSPDTAEAIANYEMRADLMP